MKKITKNALRKLSILELEELVKYHDNLYWNLATPEISDTDYDKIVEVLQQKQALNAVANNINTPAAKPSKEVTYSQPMLSLAKCYELTDFTKWWNKVEGTKICTPKLDGIAVNLRYVNGKLESASTRGSGAVGEDISAPFLEGNINNALLVLKLNSNVDIRGELYQPGDKFEQFKGQFSNSRNLVAGVIRSQSTDSKQYGLRFLPYEVVGMDLDTEMDKLVLLETLGFVACPWKQVTTIDEVSALYSGEYSTKEFLSEYPSDGIVIKADSKQVQEAMGCTSHHPKYSIAYKFQDEAVETTLTHITWDTGRTGGVAPVGWFHEVELAGAKINKASLHNPGIMEALGLKYLGSVVKVKRSGSVIPQIIEVVDHGKVPIDIPKFCMDCQTTLTNTTDGLVGKHAPDCKPVLAAKLEHFVSVLDIDSVGNKLLTQLVDKDLVKDVADLFTLQADSLSQLDRMGDKAATKIVNNIQRAKTITAPKLLQSLSIDHIGRSVTGKLTVSKQDLTELVDGVTTVEDMPWADLTPAPKESLELWLCSPDNINLINKLLNTLTVI